MLMLKPLTNTQERSLDIIVAKIPKVFGKEREIYFSAMEIAMADYLRQGFDITTYLGVYTAMSRVYESR